MKKRFLLYVFVLLLGPIPGLRIREITNKLMSRSTGQSLERIERDVERDFSPERLDDSLVTALSLSPDAS